MEERSDLRCYRLAERVYEVARELGDDELGSSTEHVSTIDRLVLKIFQSRYGAELALSLFSHIDGGEKISEDLTRINAEVPQALEDFMKYILMTADKTLSIGATRDVANILAKDFVLSTLAAYQNTLSVYHETISEIIVSTIASCIAQKAASSNSTRAVRKLTDILSRDFVLNTLEACAQQGNYYPAGGIAETAYQTGDLKTVKMVCDTFIYLLEDEGTMKIDISGAIDSVAISATGALEVVCDMLRAYRGQKDIDRVASVVHDVALYTGPVMKKRSFRDASAQVQEVCSVFRAYMGNENLLNVASEIEAAAKNTHSGAEVIKVAQKYLAAAK